VEFERLIGIIDQIDQFVVLPERAGGAAGKNGVAAQASLAD